MPVKKLRQVLCLEIMVDERCGDVTVIASIPGREGTLSRTWRATDGFLSHAQSADLSAWLTQRGLDALLAQGVQSQLFTTG